MSASKHKKKRQNDLKASAAETKKAGKGRLVLGIACAVAALALIVFFAMVTTGFFQNHTTAVTIGSHNVTPAIYNYFYQTAYQTLVSAYGDLASLAVDTSKPLDEQYYDEANGITWADAVADEAAVAMKQIYALYDMAIEQGLTLSESDMAMIDSAISMLDFYASSAGASSSDGYLTATYGTGCNVENYREYMELTQLAAACSTAYAESQEYTGEEIDTYYEANKETLDTVSYRTYPCAVYGEGTNEDGTSVIDAEASKSMADAMAEEARGDEDRFIALARENAPESLQTYYEDDNVTLVSDMTLDGLADSSRGWLTDPARQEGDTTVIYNDDGTCAVLFFVSSTANSDVNMVDVRHILVSGTEEQDGMALAEDILAQYEAGEQTEEAFAALAVEYSEDGNAAEGGIYEDVYPGQMVETFNDWCFDPARQSGDTGIVETDYGCHVMYFVGEGGSYRDYRVTEAMRVEDAEAWAAELAKAYSFTVNGAGMRFANT